MDGIEVIHRGKIHPPDRCYSFFMGLDNSISRKELNWNKPVRGHEYTFKEGAKEGDAMLIYKSVRDLSFPHSKLRPSLQTMGFQESDIIAHLNEFNPNGRGLDEEIEKNMRQGTGTRALQHLIAEALSNGAKAMYVFTGKRAMRDFLTKHGFQDIGDYFFIKKLIP